MFQERLALPERKLVHVAGHHTLRHVKIAQALAESLIVDRLDTLRLGISDVHREPILESVLDGCLQSMVVTASDGWLVLQTSIVGQGFTLLTY